jgi:hypothetical protein
MEPGNEGRAERGSARSGEREQRMRRAGALARWLDNRLLDPLIGLVFPAVGDVATSGLGGYLVYVAWKHGHGPLVMARMMLNLAIDALLGSIPVAGDIFDLLHRANMKNLALLEKHEAPSPAPDGDRGAARSTMMRVRLGDAAVLVGAAVLLIAALAVPVIAAVVLVVKLTSR